MASVLNMIISEGWNITMYNLLDSALIRCFFADGSQKELGILDTFKQSKNIVRIGGDSEVQEVVLLRLLLAIAYRALPDAVHNDAWGELWDNGLPYDTISEYLESYRNRFDLLSDETPFYQIVGAKYEGKVEPNNQFILLDYQPFKGDIAMYATFSAQGSQKLDYAFAARKLLELQAFNTASRKKIIQGDPRKNKRTYAQPGWLANGSIVHFLGKNLEQTILLNFVPYEELNIDYADDKALWEREQQTAVPEGLHGEMDESRIPLGPADLYTHQSSRVSLFHDGSKITGTVVGIGDRLFKYDMQSREPMMAWRSIVREGRSANDTTFSPVKQAPGREAWQSINGLLGSMAKAKGPQLAPAIARHINSVAESVETEFSTYVPTIVTSVFYGAQDAVIDNQVVSELDLSIDALKDAGEARTKMIRALEITETHIYIFNVLLGNILVAEGKERKPAKGTSANEIAKTQMHDFIWGIGLMYQGWIAEITNANADEKLREWIDTVFEYTKNAGDIAAANASKTAIAGRLEDSAKPDSHINAAKAHNIFSGMLYKERKGMIDDK